MSKLFKRLCYVFSKGQELDTLIEQERKNQELREWEAKGHRLHLCKKHQPSQPGAHYAEKNCDYCKLLEKAKP